MEFNILGPLEVLDDGRTVEITAPKQRALLAVLVLKANRVVSGDRLLEELWGEHQPTGGLNTLKFHVSKLRDALSPGRRAGEEGCLVTRTSGYMLQVGPDDVDAARFERLVRQARGCLTSDPAGASATFEEALRLWRGPALADFEDEPFAEIEAGHLEELRLAALEDRLSADLASGHHGEVVDELERLVAEHPFRERMWGQLMVALYRCDRQVDALRSYQRLRTLLGEELGIEPSAEITDLENRILLHDAALTKPGAVQPPGGRLRGYELQEKLGEGAFGVVWRAAQPAVGRDVAVKVIKQKFSNRPDFVRRFEAEARLVASLEHPHIVPIFDYWRDPDGAYLVMRLMRNGLDPVSGDGWDTTRVLRVAEQIGSGLSYAHRRGLHHADLHPGNVLLDSEGNAYLADFGLATSLNLGSATPPEGYASPEQRRGEPTTVASDIFGLGALVFRLFTGVDPGSLVQDRQRSLPAGIDGVLTRATAPDPADRFGDVDEFLDELRAVVGRGPAASVGELRNPYKGLRAFEEADAPDFFGRDLMTTELLDAVAHQRLIGVVGPSGSGKSSLVRAGLVPALRAGRVPGSEKWLITDLYPGIDPFEELATALLRVAVVRPDNLIERLRHPETLIGTVNDALPEGAVLVVVVDQFEELFTICPDPTVRRAFMDALRSLVMAPGSRVKVVLTLRADFYGLPLQYQPFGALLRGSVVSVAPPDPGELSEAVRRPAQLVQVEVDPDLLSEIVRDASAQPGGLPLMEYALTQLFARRSGQSLTLAGYREIGGLTGALRQWPEELFAELDPSDQVAARQVLLRLVGVDENGQDTRRRVPLTELHQLGIDKSVVDKVMQLYGSARLLTFDRDPRSRTPTVEVAHEALLREWGRLHDWIEGRREELLLHRRLRTSHMDWQDADRDEAYLLQGGRLHQFATLAEETDLALTDAERDFVRLSTLHESALANRRRRRRRVAAAGLLSLAMTATAFGIVAMAQRNHANQQTQIAEQQAALASEQTDLAMEQQVRALEQEQIAQSEAARAAEQERIATARGLAAAAVATSETDPKLSVLLAMRSVETTREADGTVLPEAIEALHRAVSTDRLVVVTPSEMWGRDLAFSPDGSRLYVGGLRTGQVVEVPSGEITEEMDHPIAAVAVAGRDDEFLVEGGFDGGLAVRDVTSLEELFTLDGHSNWITDLDVSADGTKVASIQRDGTAFVWDVVAREQLGAFTLDCETGCPGGVALSDDGSLLLTGGTIWNAATGERSDIPEVFSGPGHPVALLGKDRAAVGDGSLVRVLDLASNEVLYTLYGHTGAVLTIDARADGRLIATGGREGLAHVWEVDETAAHMVLTLPGHVGPVWKAQFSADGRYLATISGSQEWPADVVVTWPRTWEVRLWDVSTAGSHEWTTVQARSSEVSFNSDGSGVLGVNTDLGASVWDASTGAEMQRFEAPVTGGTTTAVAMSPDGRLVATAGIGAGSDAGWCTVLDTTTGATIRELITPTPGVNPQALAFSPDGEKLAVAAGSLVQVWDTATWEVEFTMQDSTYHSLYGSVAFGADSRLLTTQGFSNETDQFAPVRVWNLESQEEVAGLYHFAGNGWGDAVFSPDGRMLLSTGIARPILWEPFTGRELGVLKAPAANAISAAFSPDGSRIATGEGDGTIRIWHSSTAEQELALDADSGQVDAVAFSPDGKRLASVSAGGALRVWALDIDDLLALARNRVARDLTDAECRAYVGKGCPPAPAIERLVPAQSDAAGPVGISEGAWAAATSRGSWQRLEAPGPDGDPLLYDTLSDTLVAMSLAGPSVFDRASDTWKQGSPAPAVPDDIATELGNPEPSLGGAAYHPGLDAVLVSRSDDGATLAYKPESDTWSVLAPKGPFVFRYGEGMVYDIESNLIVSFGGAEWGRIEDGKHKGLADTWTYATDRWVEQTPATSPPGRVNHGIVYDSAADRIIVFGGSTGFGVGEVLGDTWAYDTNTNTWAEMSPAVSPPARANAAMWYDPVADLVSLFGGTEDTSWPPLPWKMFGGEELWTYDYETNTWTLYKADPNPGYWIGSGTAVFDLQTGAAVLTGGDWYDEDRRYQGQNTTAWTYRDD